MIRIDEPFRDSFNEASVRRYAWLLPCFLIAIPLGAQWRLTLAAGPAVTAGHSRDDLDPEEPAILPDHPVNWTLAVGRDLGSWRVALEAHRLTSDLAVRGNTTSLVTRSALGAWGSGLELARRLGQSSTGLALWSGVGAVVERWSFDVTGGDPRWRAAGRVAVQLDVPLSRRWSGMLRTEGVAGPSLFTAEELPEGYRPRRGVRAGLLLGVTLAHNSR